MATKKKEVSSDDLKHTVKYTERNGEAIVARFHSAGHAAMLTDRLKQQNVPHEYVDDSETAE